MGERSVELDHLLHELQGVLALPVQAQSVGLDPRHVEEVLDQAIHPLRRAEDHLCLFASLRLRERLVEQQPRAHDDRVQRVAEVVRHDSQHPIARQERLLCPAVEPGVVHLQGGELDEPLGERQIAVVVGAAGGDEEDHTEQPVAGEEGDGHEGPRPERL